MTEAIRLDAAGKRYWKLDEYPTLMGSLAALGRDRRSELWAIRDISMSVERGETLGIIGRNGAGKTTLLKLLAGVTSPSEGRVHVVGPVAPLIGLGVGFRAEMSGRDNVMVNGMLLGVDRDTIKKRFDDIVEFAELRSFIDTPVKFYSSGMFLRLAFGVAIHTDPQVLLVDEVLAVGDLAFQAKCMARILEMQASGTTIVLVNHSMHTIRKLSNRVMLLRQGRVDFLGDPEAAVGRYHELLSVDGHQDVERFLTFGEHMFVGGAVILDRHLIGPDGMSHVASQTRPLKMQLRVRFERPVESPIFGITITAGDGTRVYDIHSPFGLKYRNYKEGDEATVSITFTPRLLGGSYKVTSQVATPDARGIIVTDQIGLMFFVEERPGTAGLVDLEGRFVVDGLDLEPADPRVTTEIVGD
jgi:ABC-type polysaccharide/polyol phosphate transport system ATPase subunit